MPGEALIWLSGADTKPQKSGALSSLTMICLQIPDVTVPAQTRGDPRKRPARLLSNEAGTADIFCRRHRWPLGTLFHTRLKNMSNDHETTLADLKQTITQFVEERDWLQFHDPKNLVLAMTSEVGELADHFRWVKNTESHALATSPEHSQHIADELADILMFAVEFASVCKIDIATAIADKLEQNAARYPVEKAKGSSEKYNRLQ